MVSNWVTGISEKVCSKLGSVSQEKTATPKVEKSHFSALLDGRGDDLAGN